MATFYGVKRKTGRITPAHELPAPRSTTRTAPPVDELAGVDEHQADEQPAETGELEVPPIESARGVTDPQLSPPTPEATWPEPSSPPSSPTSTTPLQ